jgi:hypothetical protein
MALAYLAVFILVAVAVVFSTLQVRLGRLVGLLLVLLATAPFSYLAAGMEVTFAEAFFLAMGFVFGCVLLFWKKCSLVATPIDRHVLLFLLANLVVIALSIRSGNHWLNAVREFFAYFRIFAAVFLVMNLLGTRNELEWLVRLAMTLCAAACIFGFCQYLTGAGMWVDEYGIHTRVFSFFRNPNIFGGYLELMFFLALSRAYNTTEQRSRRLAVALVALIVVSIVITYSRAALLCTVAATFVFLWVRGSRRSLVVLGILAATGLCLSLVLGGALLSRQFALISDPLATLREYTILHRIAQYLHYIQIIAANPVLGLGWGVNSVSTFIIDFFPAPRILTSFGALNSIYFDLAVKSGIPSMLLFLYAIVALLRYIGRNAAVLPAESLVRCVADAVVFGGVALLMHQTMDNMLKWPQVGYMFAVLAAIALKGINLNRGEEQCYRIC